MSAAPSERPALARVHTRTSEDKRKAALNRGVRFNVDGRLYEVRIGDLSALDSLAFRKEVGIPFSQALALSDEDEFDVDLLAGLMWMARRVAGERDLTFVEVASEVGYEQMFGITAAEPQGGDEDHPEA